MKRLIFPIGALVALLVWIWSGTRPPIGAPAPSPGDCAEIAVWSNGFHSDLTFSAALLGQDHPLRRLDPGARYILVGWGDEAFFRSNGADMLLGARALWPGGATTMHVVYGDQPIETFYHAARMTRVAVSRAGAAALARRLTDTLQLGPGGGAQVIAPGHGGPRSYFLKARGEFDLFNVCNQWTARSLRAAGVNINAAFLYTGDFVTAALVREPHACPAH